MILGNDGEAAAAARRAAALFAGAGRTPWIALAEYIGAMAAARVDPAAAIPTLEAAAATLTGLGWPGETAEVLVRLGEVALAAGDVERARTALSRAVAMRRRASVRVRAAAWHATALLRLIEDRPAAARRAIDAGLRIVDRHRASLGASELRARAAADGVELAELGLRLAMRSGRPTDVLIAAERWRAGSLATRTDVGRLDAHRRARPRRTAPLESGAARHRRRPDVGRTRCRVLALGGAAPGAADHLRHPVGRGRPSRRRHSARPRRAQGRTGCADPGGVHRHRRRVARRRRVQWPDTSDPPGVAGHGARPRRPRVVLHPPTGRHPARPSSAPRPCSSSIAAR